MSPSVLTARPCDRSIGYQRSIEPRNRKRKLSEQEVSQQQPAAVRAQPTVLSLLQGGDVTEYFYSTTVLEYFIHPLHLSDVVLVTSYLTDYMLVDEFSVSTDEM